LNRARVGGAVAVSTEEEKGGSYQRQSEVVQQC
jgi:hypothetical protein